MSNFILISNFKELYDSQAELLTAEGVEQFIKRLNSPEGENVRIEKNIGIEDFNLFLNSLNDPSTVLFHGWVAQNEGVKLLLEGKKSIKQFDDKHGHLNHQFSSGYKVFLSPFLAPQLLRFTGEKEIDSLSKAMSYVCLLDADHRTVVESQLFQVINEQVNALKEATKSLEFEQDLIDLIKPLCGADYLACVNSLSKASYALKLNYVDQILAVIKSKACTVRFANWILKQMEGIQLNDEHQYKIIDLRRELKEGELKVRNQGEGKTPIRWKNVFTTAFVLVLSFGVFYVIYYKPFSEVTDPQFNNNSSFKQFSKEERKKIDSLLQQMSGNKRPEDFVYDQGVPIIGGGSTLTLRKEFKNPTMERIYEDLCKDAALKDQGFRDSCENNEPYKRLEGIRDLHDKKGDIEVVVRNESEYNVVIFVSENSKNGETHSLFMKIGETVVFEMDKYNTIMAVAGDSYQKYSHPSNALVDELPSDKFTHHFCETDVNYKESINTAYKLVNMKQGKTKMMIMGDKGNFFHLIDVHGVLEAL